MSVKVEFVACHEELGYSELIVERENLRPVPAHKCLPDWFKHMPSHRDDIPTAKRCPPIVDAMYKGYILKAHCYIRGVIDDNGDVSLDARTPHQPVEPHRLSQTPEYLDYFKSPAQHVLKWLSPWAIKTPKGYSCMYTHPLNAGSTDVRFTTGVVDTDNLFIRVNPTFYIERGVKEFIINEGDPLVQIIPFKREESSLEIRVGTEQDYHDERKSCISLGIQKENSYRENYWHRRKG